MNKPKINKVLLLGSGALQIGQAGEFDYSGSQAIKALKEEGIKVILINPNIATIQTSQGFADRVYFLPVEPHFVEEVIKKEKPDGILLSFGGQTALNCGLELSKTGTLTKYKVQVLGTPISAIEKTEDRQLFAKNLQEINLLIPKSQAVKSIVEATKTAKKIGYPIIIRGAFSLGGQDSGVATNQAQLKEIATRALTKTSQILVEEYLTGWKEIEYEVVRDKFDNCITVCNMENVDPMGIHTGESIVVAPSQTLNNFEYHTLREIAIKVIRNLKIVGECNIQFALNPRPKWEVGNEIKNPASHFSHLTSNLDYRIIEVNARLSRSSALASKATGYPLAYVATKLALGYSLTELKNSVTKKTIACFEPALDYLVVKIPRWDLAKFLRSENQIGPSMQSVGEVMAVGRKFEEALQKATRMLDIGLEGPLDEKAPDINFTKPTPWRIFAIAYALKKGASIQKIYQTTGIDPFFLYKVKNIAEFEKVLSQPRLVAYTQAGVVLEAKQLGFSDKRIAFLTKSSEEKIRNLRHQLNIRPSVKQIDTLAAEYPAQTNYLYLTYNGESDDIILSSKSQIPNPIQYQNSKNKNSKRLENLNLKNSDLFRISDLEIRNSQNYLKVIVLGSGPYRIGSSVEFDWCSVTAAQTLIQNNLAPIMINCNPETVSTDYDMASKLYFEELTAETVLEIYQKEKPIGVIVSMGGQTPNNLVMPLAKNGVKILGTSPKSIDTAEDRSKFSKLCDKLKINQPTWAKLKGLAEAIKFAESLGYPVLVRPSYVLSGAAMNVAFNSNDLKGYLKIASRISEEYPVVISKFYQNAKELEIDAVAKTGQILTYAITEHVENAGVHSGDSTMVLPPQKIYQVTKEAVIEIAQKIAKNLKITGPFNIQFLARDNKVMVIECNLRASRSLPFVSKVTGVNFAKVATKAILSELGVTPVEGLPTAHSLHMDHLRNIEEVLKDEHWREGNRRQDPKLLPADSATNGISYVGVKTPQFSFARIKGADPVLRVEMASTGEVACFGQDIHEAYLKCLIATGIKLPKKSVFLSLADEYKQKFLESAYVISQIGLEIYATEGTAKFLSENKIEAQILHKIFEHKKPNVLDFLLDKKIDLVINIIDPYIAKQLEDDYLIRRAAIDFNVPLLTNLQGAELFIEAISQKKLKDLKALPWNSYVTNIN